MSHEKVAKVDPKTGALTNVTLPAAGGTADSGTYVPTFSNVNANISGLLLQNYSIWMQADEQIVFSMRLSFTTSGGPGTLNPAFEFDLPVARTSGNFDANEQGFGQGYAVKPMSDTIMAVFGLALTGSEKLRMGAYNGSDGFYVMNLTGQYKLTN